jgi:hypothetical protein
VAAWAACVVAVWTGDLGAAATTSRAATSASAPASGPASGPATKLAHAASPGGDSYIGIVLRSRDTAKSVVSQSNMSNLAKAMGLYTLSHQDKYPATLDELVKLGYVDARMLASPLDPKVRYVYIPGAKLMGDPQRILVYDPVSFNGKVLVLRGDHSVENVPEDEFLKELAGMKQ